MSNAQLPDLLNGTVNNNNSMGLDAKQLLKNLGSFNNNEAHDDWENAFKYLMSKSSTNFNNKHYEEHQQEDWLRFQEMRKHSNMSGATTAGGQGGNHFNSMFNSECLSFHTQNFIFSHKKNCTCEHLH
jgi:hypothetical protein